MSPERLDTNPCIFVKQIIGTIEYLSLTNMRVYKVNEKRASPVLKILCPEKPDKQTIQEV